MKLKLTNMLELPLSFCISKNPVNSDIQNFHSEILNCRVFFAKKITIFRSGMFL